MKVRIFAALLVGISAPAWSATHMGKLVGSMFPGDLNHDCIYFTPVGVPQADPAVSSSPHFAIPRSRSNARDQYALLLAAKLSGAPINVATTGSGECGGWAAVNWVELAE